VDSSTLAIIFSVGLPLVIVAWAFTQMRGDTAKIKKGIPADALVESIGETGTTISSPSVGPDAPVYHFKLLVTPPAGGTPYRTEMKHAVPRLYVPMVLPGITMGVRIDPKDPMRVAPDWDRFNGAALNGAAAAGFGAAEGGFGGNGPGARAVTMTFDGSPGGDVSSAAAGSVPGAAPMLSFDANGTPSAGGVDSLIGALRGGSVPTLRGSAATILATGTHGTAVITTAMPLGETAGQVNPSIDPSQANDPIWVFTLEVSLAGQPPFPAAFGHRVPADKVGLVAPGVRLSVAVDPQNQYQHVAIDWDRSPLAG
jgi:hypothetical protein